MLAYIENLLGFDGTNIKNKNKQSMNNGDSVNKPLSHDQIMDLEKTLNHLDDYTADQYEGLIKEFNIKSPVTGNDLSSPMPFNLMFGTFIGPSGMIKGYLRPETAQGIFVNFKRLLEFNQGKLPFAAAQIGNSFRNEISPRSGLLRVREFTMAEIEHFVDPVDKKHPKFEEVSHLKLKLFSAESQMDNQIPCVISLSEAVTKKMIDNETLAFFMARIYLFLLDVGVSPEKIRFRQHMKNEMAHYACDCWDAECHTSYGWIECVGCADRSCYDLNQHRKATGVKLIAEKLLDEPVVRNVTEIVVKKDYLGKVFRRDSKEVLGYFSLLDENESEKMAQKLENEGQIDITISDERIIKITKDMVIIKRYEKKIHTEEIVPSVIEPSFGIGRIMYAILEHNFRVRENDDKRTYFALPSLTAPYKCSILPLSNNPSFKPLIKTISKALTNLNVSHKVDSSSGSIGRRYARTDEIAIPFGITIDFDSLLDVPSVTLRERDSMLQIRANVDEVPQLVNDLCDGKIKWEDVQTLYPKFLQQENKGGD